MSDAWKNSYDEWKLASPEDERPAHLCPFCGAYSTSQCEFEDDTETCPWEESEPDPDALREDQAERRRMANEDWR